MRRKDREVTDNKRIREIIENCNCCRLGLNDNGEVYIVPLNFGYEQQNDGSYVFYFHSAKEGRKIEIIRRNSNVGFEADTGYELIKGDNACQYSAKYQSVTGNGIITFVDDTEEKKKGLSLIMQHSTGKKEWHFDEKALNVTTVLKLKVSKISCKEH